MTFPFLWNSPYFSELCLCDQPASVVSLFPFLVSGKMLCYANKQSIGKGSAREQVALGCCVSARVQVRSHQSFAGQPAEGPCFLMAVPKLHSEGFLLPEAALSCVCPCGSPVPAAGLWVVRMLSRGLQLLFFAFLPSALDVHGLHRWVWGV